MVLGFCVVVIGWTLSRARICVAVASAAATTTSESAFMFWSLDGGQRRSAEVNGGQQRWPGAPPVVDGGGPRRFPVRMPDAQDPAPSRAMTCPSESFGFEPCAQQSFQVNFSGLVRKLSGQAHFAAAAPSSLPSRGFLCVLHLHRKPNCRSGRARSARRPREPTIPGIPAPPSWPPVTEGSSPSLLLGRFPVRLAYAQEPAPAGAMGAPAARMCGLGWFG